jgi:hypothetical protein
MVLQQGTETADVDYKSTLDLSQTRDKVELAKDVAAFQAVGGHIAIGVDGQGRPTGEMTSQTATLFDEARLRPMLLRYLPEPLQLTSAVHEVEGKVVVLVYVHPHPDGFVVIPKVGTCPDPADPKRQKAVFSEGDVFIRRGTESAKWRPADVAAVLARRDERIREEARKEFAATVAALDSAGRGRGLAAAPALAFAWKVDADAFTSAVLELVRHNDRLPLRLFFARAVGEARPQLTPQGPSPDLEVLLDRLAQTAGIALAVDDQTLFEQSLTTLRSIYRIAVGPDEYSRPDLETGAVKLWWSIIGRIEAIGAAAVRAQAWPQARALALQSPADGAERRPSAYVSWLRHGLTEAARAGLLNGPTPNSPQPAALIHAARAVTHRLDALRLDYPDDSAYGTAEQPGRDDVLLDSICQFDAAYCVTAHAAKPNRSQFYPSFCGLYARRSEPILVRLLDDPAVYNNILPGVSEEQRTQAVTEVAQTAEREGWQINDGPYFFADDRL